MTKIGLIIDEGHLKKSQEFLNYIRTIAEVKIYLVEKLVIDPLQLTFDEDLFFVKARGDIILNFVSLIENTTSIPIINSHKGIFLAVNRFMGCVMLRKAGIPVPNFSIIPVGIDSPYDEYIIKNLVDDKISTFTPEVEKIDGKLHVKDKRAIQEAKDNKVLFYQDFIKSKWEYKIYGFGENLFFYKQLPVLVNPNKMESRVKMEEIPELREYSLNAMKALNLKVVSIDYLKSKDGNYYLTDINSTPNFNYIKEGPKIIGDFLVKQTKL